MKTYQFIFTQFQIEFGYREVDTFTPDEIIFKTVNPRNRIMLELMAISGIRVGEVLKIRPLDVQDRKITLPEPKSGKESEVVFIPQKVADRLKEYIKEKDIEPQQRIFPITYNAARIMVQKAGKMVGIHLWVK